MTLKFTKQEVKSVLKQTTGGKPFFKVEKALKGAGLGSLLQKSSLTREQFRKVGGALREAGLTHKQTGEIVRAAEREIKTGEEARHLETSKKTAAAWRGERARREEEAIKRQKERAVTSIFETQKIAHSALKSKTAPGRPETTTSIFRKPEKSAPSKEEKPPVAIDLPID